VNPLNRKIYSLYICMPLSGEVGDYLGIRSASFTLDGSSTEIK
jgi:hypothetical protein